MGALIFFNIIISCIFKRLKKYAIIFPEDESLSEMVSKKLLEPFAHLETKRKNYHKEDINIVIDATDWGHIVGEIEVMVCADKGKISEATKRIEDLGKELDFNYVKHGKMRAFLKKFKPKSYDILLSLDQK